MGPIAEGNPMTFSAPLAPVSTGVALRAVHGSPVLTGLSQGCERLGRVLLEADFEPLVFFVGVFFLWVDKQLHLGAHAIPANLLALRGFGA